LKRFEKPKLNVGFLEEFDEMQELKLSNVSSFYSINKGQKIPQQQE